jgi:hypothetical protein
MKQIVVLMSLWFMATGIKAQTDPEYRLELGAGAGLVAYEGDFNNSLLKGMRPMGELVAKYKPNPRMAWVLNVGYGKLKGSSTKADTWYPDFNPVGIDFNTSLYDVAFRYEYNFWPYGTGREYHGAQRLTPFIAIGLGLSVSSSKLTQNGVDMKRTAAAGQMPVGIGVKYKMGDRWNLAVEWTMHFTGNDKLDGIADPYDITSSGLFKNTDCYSLLGVTITYDLWAKCKTCHNDRD